MVKEMEVEKIYQKKSQLEHILLRPDTYIGSVELLQQEMWIWDFENEKMIKKEISFVPGLYKIFDEILGKAVTLLPEMCNCFEIDYIIEYQS
jgi:DNA topoisomerase-2